MTAASNSIASRDSARRWDVILAAVLLAATVLVCLPALHGERLLDDDVHVTRPELRSLAGLARIWMEVGATQQYYPVLHTAFWLEHGVWGDAVAGYHLTNVVLHLVAALLVVAIMRRLELRGGWLAAFVFALHPICVESVAWISEQKNTLSTVFYLGAALVFIRYRERRKTSDYLLASGLFAGALLSKTATATLPAALLVIAWWRHGRVDLRRDIVPLIPWLGAALSAGLITVSVERTLISGIDADLSFTWYERILIAGRAPWFYLGKLLWPANLSFLYERWMIDAADPKQFLPPVFGVALAAALMGWTRRNRGPLATLLCFVGMLLPTLGLVNVEWFVFSFVADHFQYLASLGIIIPVAAAVTPFAFKLSVPRQRLMLAAAAFIVGVLGVLSWRHSHTFRDNVALYTNAVARAPGSIPAHYLLGVALAERPGREADAVAAFETALRLNPDAAEVHEKLATLLLPMEDRRRAALTHLEAAWRLKPDLPTVRLTLANAWFDEGKALAARPALLGDAIAAYERALQLNPDFAEANFNLGNLLLRMPGRRNDAIAHFESAVRLKPDFAEAHTNLGSALAADPDRLIEAIAHFEAALRANPDFAPARNNLARARQSRE